eukprot:scaffold36283_cov129-Isochrysis_galbana.AAC.1
MLRAALLRPRVSTSRLAVPIQRQLISFARTCVALRSPWAPLAWQQPRPCAALLLLRCDPSGSRSITNPSRRHPKSYPIPSGKSKKRRATPKKLKSHKGAKRRFKLRGDGSWTHRAAGKSHLQVGLRRRSILAKRKPRVVKLKGLALGSCNSLAVSSGQRCGNTQESQPAPTAPSSVVGGDMVT